MAAGGHSSGSVTPHHSHLAYASPMVPAFSSSTCDMAYPPNKTVTDEAFSMGLTAAATGQHHSIKSQDQQQVSVRTGIRNYNFHNVV